VAEAQTRFNFLVGEPSAWREDVPSYEIVGYEGLYDGIDLHTWGRRDHLKYEFHVAPGADFSQIGVSYSGIDALSIDDGGALHVRLPGDWGEVVDDAPYIYQVIDGEQVEVAGAYRLVDGDTYEFEITGSYDPTRGLIIDPDLDWSSYLGGGSRDDGRGIAADAAGNVLVTGGTWSSGWVSGGWDTSFGGSQDAFVARVATALTADAWYSAGFHGPLVGEGRLEIADDGTFSEPRVNGVTWLRIEFSWRMDAATFSPTSVRIAGKHVNGDPVDLSGIDVATARIEDDRVGIIQFTAALPDVAKYVVQIEGVTDAGGSPLAGDNDRVFTALAGDSTGDLRVNAIDLSYVWPRRTILIDGVSADQTRSDVTCDGRINAIDLSAAWPRRGADMRDVADPVLPSAAGGSRGSVESDDLAAAAWVEAKRGEGDRVDGDRVDALEGPDPGRAGPGLGGGLGARAALGYRRRAEGREAPGAHGTRSEDGVAVSLVEALPALGLGEELVDGRLDVLGLPDLHVLKEG